MWPQIHDHFTQVSLLYVWTCFIFHRPNAGRGTGSGAHGAWSGDASRNLGFEMYDQQITINVGEESQNNQAAKAPAKKRPVWLMESTVEGAVNETSATSENTSLLKAGSSKPSSKNREKEEIIRALLAHERKSGTQAVIPGDANSDAESDASVSDDDFIGMSTSAPITHTVEMDSGDEDDEEEEEVMVMVGGQPVLFQDVTDDLVAQMLPAEKEAYIKKGQEAYSAMYDWYITFIEYLAVLLSETNSKQSALVNTTCSVNYKNFCSSVLNCLVYVSMTGKKKWFGWKSQIFILPCACHLNIATRGTMHSFAWGS